MPRDDTKTTAPHSEAQDVGFGAQTPSNWATPPEDVAGALDGAAAGDIGIYLQNIIEDLTPQLGADLDCNTFGIISDSAIAIKPSGAANDYLSFSFSGVMPTISIVGGSLAVVQSDSNVVSWGVQKDITHYLDMWYDKIADVAVLESSQQIDVRTSGDTNDYITLSTAANVPQIGTTGSCNLKITSSGGTIDFDNDILSTTGTIVTTGQLNGGSLLVSGLSQLEGNVRIHGGILDSNGDEILLFSPAGGTVVNEITVGNSEAGDPVTIAATGGDAEITLRLSPKGNAAASKICADRRLEVNHDGNAAIACIAYSSASATSRANCLLQRARGTEASPATVVNGDRLGQFSASGYTDAFYARANVIFSVDGAPSGSTVPTQIEFQTGTSSSTTRLSIASGGNIRVASTNRMEFNTTAAYIYAPSAGNLTIQANTLAWVKGSTTVKIEGGSDVQFWEGNVEQINIADQNIVFHPASGADTRFDFGTGGQMVMFTASTPRFSYNATGLAFNSGLPVAQPTVTGTRIDPEGALADLLTDLATLGLIVDSTTAGTVERHIETAGADYGVGASAPTKGSVGNYRIWTYAIGDDSEITVELPHDWAAGTDVIISVDWAINRAYATENAEVQWNASWTATDHTGTEALDAASTTVDPGDQNIPANAKSLTRTTLGTIAGASLSAEDEIGITITRVALDGGNNPGGGVNPYITHVHVAYTASY